MKREQWATNQREHIDEKSSLTNWWKFWTQALLRTKKLRSHQRRLDQWLSFCRNMYPSLLAVSGFFSLGNASHLICFIQSSRKQAKRHFVRGSWCIQCWGKLPYSNIELLIWIYCYLIFLCYFIFVMLNGQKKSVNSDYIIFFRCALIHLPSYYCK